MQNPEWATSSITLSLLDSSTVLPFTVHFIRRNRQQSTIHSLISPRLQNIEPECTLHSISRQALTMWGAFSWPIRSLFRVHRFWNLFDSEFPPFSLLSLSSLPPLYIDYHHRWIADKIERRGCNQQQNSSRLNTESSGNPITIRFVNCAAYKFSLTINLFH